MFFVGKLKCGGTFRFQRLYYVQHIFWSLEDILGNFLKDASRTVFLNIPLVHAQGKRYSKAVIYRYGIFSKKLKKLWP